MNEGTVYSVVRVKGTKKGKSCKLPLLGLEWQGEAAVSLEPGRSGAGLSRTVALEEHVNCGKQKGSGQDGHPNPS